MRQTFLTGQLQVKQTLAWLSVAVACMGLDAWLSPEAWLRQKIALVVSPVHQVLDAPAQLGYWLYDWASFKSYLVQQNAELQAQLQILQVQVQQQHRLLREHKELVAFEQHPQSWKRTRVLSGAWDVFGEHLWINQGTKQGIQTGELVLDGAGVVGIIHKTEAMTSQVLLLTAPSVSIPAMVAHTGQRGIIEGIGEPWLLLRHIPWTAGVKVGQLILSSGFGSKIPEGFVIGEVIEVQREAAEPFATVKVRPTANLQGSVHLVVLTNP